MYAQFRYLDGSRAGEAKVVSNDFATIGRHPNSDVGFADQEHPDVSVRHAAVFKQGGGFMIRDLGSTNGTLLNGVRVRGDQPLGPTDLVQLGPHGPRLEFSISSGRGGGPPPSGPATATQPPSAEIYRPRNRTTERLSPGGLPRPTRRPVHWVGAALAVVAGLSASVGAWRAREHRAVIHATREALLARIGDHLTQLTQVRSGIGALQTALAAAKNETGLLRGSVALRSDPTVAALDSLRVALDHQTAEHDALLRAARFDPSRASSLGLPTAAAIIGDLRGGVARTGSAIAIMRRGDTVWMATTKAMVVDSVGIPASRIVTIWHGATEARLAGLVRTGDSMGVALLSTMARSGVPIPAPATGPVAVGDPVVAVGFRYGADSLGDWRKTGAVAHAFVGSVLTVEADRLEIDGYGVEAPIGGGAYSETGTLVGLVIGSSGGRWQLIPISSVLTMVAR